MNRIDAIDVIAAVLDANVKRYQPEIVDSPPGERPEHFLAGLIIEAIERQGGKIVSVDHQPKGEK